MNPELFQHDPILYPAIRHIQLPEITPSDNYFQYLLRAIAFQQLSGKAGATIHARFLDLFPDRDPEPESVLQMETERLRSAGLSYQKAAYMQNIARFWREENLSNPLLDGLDDPEVLQLLTQIKGVGKWTVEVFMMFGMGRPDLFPLDDLGLQQGVAGIFNVATTDLKSLKLRMAEWAENWRPYRSLAARFIWAWKDA